MANPLDPSRHLLSNPTSLTAILHSSVTTKDLQLVSKNGKSVAVHSIVLVAASSVLADSCHTMEDAVVLLTDWSEGALVLLVEYIYTGLAVAACQEQRRELENLLIVLGIGRKREEKDYLSETLLVKAEPNSSVLEMEAEEEGSDQFYHFMAEPEEEFEEEPVKKKPKTKKKTDCEEDLDFVTSSNSKRKATLVKNETGGDIEEETGETGDFKCSHCTKTFTQKRKWEEHEIKHTGEKLKCQHCPKVFDRPGLRRVHEQLHTKPFKCTECEAAFGRKSNLIGHQRIHRGERPFICDLCGRGFPIQSSLLTHKKQSHPDGSKTWLCDFCEHKFVSKSQLEIHRRVHTGEKPWICDTCGRGFTTKQNMLDHTRLHTDKMDYCCTKCGEQFKWKQSLERHLMDHTGVTLSQKEPFS